MRPSKKQTSENLPLLSPDQVSKQQSSTLSAARRDDVDGDVSDDGSSGGGRGTWGVSWLLNNLVDVLRSTVSLTTNREELPEETTQQLDTIAALEEPCNVSEREWI